MSTPISSNASALSGPVSAAPVTSMRALAHEVYGPLETLRVVDRPVPACGEWEVLVHVRAAAIHVADAFGVRGSPLPMRMASGLFRPTIGIPGYDLAGEVEAVGARVTRFRPGQRVMGVGAGTCAERSVAKEEALVSMPEGLSFEEAAAVPTSGIAALAGLRAGGVKAGQRVLINGASGGVGSFAVQIAKALGASVTGVCSAVNVERVRALGADRAIDYGREDFTAEAGAWDVIFDNVENHPLSRLRHALSPGGTLVLNSSAGGGGLGLMVRLLAPLVINPFVKQRLCRYLSGPNREDLEALGAWLASGAVRPLIDRVVPLEQVPAALAYLETGRAHGKVVVRP